VENVGGERTGESACEVSTICACCDRQQNKVYMTMQPGLPPLLASMGVDGVGSASGVLEAMEKREAKKSIDLCLMEMGQRSLVRLKLLD